MCSEKTSSLVFGDLCESRWWFSQSFKGFKHGTKVPQLDISFSLCKRIVYWNELAWYRMPPPRNVSNGFKLVKVVSTQRLNWISQLSAICCWTGHRYWFCDRHSPSSIFMSGKAAYESVSSAFVPLLVTGVLFMNQCRWRWLDSHSQTKTNANLNSSTERRQFSKRLWGFKAPCFSLECYIPKTPADESWKHLFQRGLEVLPARPFSLLFAGPKELPTNLDW